MSDAKTAIIEITTSISTSVNAPSPQNCLFLDARDIAVPPRSMDRSNLPPERTIAGRTRARSPSIVAPETINVEIVLDQNDRSDATLPADSKPASLRRLPVLR